jgi:WD40 repeat protein
MLELINNSLEGNARRSMMVPQLKVDIGATGGVKAISGSGDGKYLLTAPGNSGLKLWDLLKSGRQVAVVAPMTEPLLNIFLSRQAEVIAAVTRSGVLHTTRTRGKTGSLRLHPTSLDRITAAAASSDGQYAILGRTDGSVVRWDIAAEREAGRLAGPPAPVTAVAGDGANTAAGWADGTVRLWSRSAGLLRTLHIGGAVTTMALGARDLLIVGTSTGEVQVWDIAQGTRKAHLRPHAEPITALAMPSDQLAVSAAADGTVETWRLLSGERGRTLLEKGATVNGLALTPDRDRVFVARDDGFVYLLDIRNGEVVLKMVFTDKGGAVVDGDGRIDGDAGTLDKLKFEAFSNEKPISLAALMPQYGDPNLLAKHNKPDKATLRPVPKPFRKGVTREDWKELEELALAPSPGEQEGNMRPQ